ncbi:UPF0225 protein [Vibrio zhanjiangensis]|uniref:UPF0225 protein n=1 Tax=Vibrio zhanjiangensis TaxID=1046128 RepID=A0ABQ6EWS9_9VIBR|nr:YchJ family metal-binding protein [Vibrio zhanjiangensis]GLT17658.1 UPF0225 protein [Vibrio zhanjiangensis]
MQTCPCGTNRSYADCCEPIHKDHAKAKTPEQLMRSRYSAHVKGLVDYVIETYHPSCNAQIHREAIEQSIESNWCKLVVLKIEHGTCAQEGFVTFKAFYTEQDIEYCLEERSRFVKDNGLWYYIDGTFPNENSLDDKPNMIKIGRNDPCFCGSGKKYKKCCG